MARSTASAPGAPPPPGGEAPPFGAAGACDVWGTRSCLFPPDAAPGGELVGGADQIARALEQEISRHHAATLPRVAPMLPPPPPRAGPGGGPGGGRGSAGAPPGAGDLSPPCGPSWPRRPDPPAPVR